MKLRVARRRIAFHIVVLMLLLTVSGQLLAADGGDDISMVVAKQFTIDSKVLGEPRPVLVSLPDSYEEGETRYPLLIVLDGSPAAAYLARASLSDVSAPEFVIAAVPNVDRLRDLTHTNIGEIWPTSGGADRFLAFLTDELLPWLDVSFRTTDYHVITGGSAAGSFAAFALFQAPEAFDAAIARSPMLGTDYELISGLARKCFSGEPRSEHFLFMVHGSHDYPGVTVFTDRLVRLLEDEAPPWLRFGREVLPAKGHYQFAGLNVGMTALFAGLGFPGERFLAGDASAVESRAEMLRRRFGTELTMATLTSERAITDAACELGRQRRFADATRVLAYGLDLHPRSAALVYYMAQMLEHASRAEEAIAAYNRVFGMKPSPGVAGMTRIFLDNLSRVTVDTGDLRNGSAYPIPD